jgi:hypothetical protein
MQELQHGGAFVVQLRTGTDFSAGQVTGRVEHIATGRHGQFESVDALFYLIAGVLAETRSLEPPPQPAQGEERSDVESR